MNTDIDVNIKVSKGYVDEHVLSELGGGLKIDENGTITGKLDINVVNHVIKQLNNAVDFIMDPRNMDVTANDVSKYAKALVVYIFALNSWKQTANKNTLRQAKANVAKVTEQINAIQAEHEAEKKQLQASYEEEKQQLNEQFEEEKRKIESKANNAAKQKNAAALKAALEQNEKSLTDEFTQKLSAQEALYKAEVVKIERKLDEQKSQSDEEKERMRSLYKEAITALTNSMTTLAGLDEKPQEL